MRSALLAVALALGLGLCNDRRPGRNGGRQRRRSENRRRHERQRCRREGLLSSPSLAVSSPMAPSWLGLLAWGYRPYRYWGWRHHHHRHYWRHHRYWRFAHRRQPLAHRMNGEGGPSAPPSVRRELPVPATRYPSAKSPPAKRRRSACLLADTNIRRFAGIAVRSGSRCACRSPPCSPRGTRRDCGTTPSRVSAT